MPAGYKSEVHDKLLTVAEVLEAVAKNCSVYKADRIRDAMKMIREVNARCDEGNLQRVKT